MGKTLKIGFITTHGNSEGQSLLFQGLTDAAETYDARILHFTAQIVPEDYDHFSPQLEQTLQAVEKLDLDGLMFLGWMPGITGSFEENFRKRFSHMPLYSLGSENQQLPHAYADPQEAITAMLEHQIEKHGHRHIVFVPPALYDLRQKTFENVMRQHGLFDESLIVSPEIFANIAFERQMEAVAAHLLDENPRPLDTVIVMFDAHAEHFLRELESRGLKVPKDVALLSLEDTQFARFSLPPLTAITFPWYDLAYQGLQQFLALLRQDEAVHVLRVDCQLVLRSSCGCKLHEPIMPSPDQAVRRLGSDKLWDRLKLLASKFGQQHPRIGFDFSQMVMLLHEDLHQAKPARLYEYFSYWLDRSVMENPDPDWVEKVESVIHDLRQEALPMVAQNRELLLRFQEIFLQLMDAIEERVVFASGHSNAQIKTINQELHYVSQDLILTYDLDKLLYILERDLKKLQIPSCAILYRDPEALSGHSRIFYHQQRQPQSSAVRSVDLQNTILEFVEDHGHVLCQPLSSGLDAYGYILYEPRLTDLRMYQALTLHVASAIKNTLLLKKLQSEIKLRRQKEQQLKHSADHDALSGLLNRRSFNQVLHVLSEQEGKEGTAYRKGFYLAFIDFDDFKKVNDRYGHDVGDMLIIEIADRLRDSLGSHRLALSDNPLSGVSAPEILPVFRIGGDEFTAIFLGQSEKQLEDAMTQLLATMRQPYRLAGHDISVSCSIGISHYPGHATKAEDLLKKADLAMYAAKHQKNTFRLFDPDSIKAATGSGKA